jgi:hypothetical protein
MGCLYQSHIFIYMRCFVYIHRRLDNNEVFYVGRGTVPKKASGNCDTNTYRRAYCKHKHNKFWMRITSKVSWIVEIVGDFLSWEESIILEKEYIKKYGRRDLNEGTLVNFTDGGEGSIGLMPSQLSISTQRNKMSSESNPMKKEHNKKKTSERLKKNNPMFNLNTQQKLSESLKKYWNENSEKHPRKGKPREDLKLRNLTNNPTKNPEVVEKIRLSALNRDNKGGKSPNAKKVQHLKTGNIYDSIIECMKGENLSHTSVYRYIKKGKIIYI